MGTRMLQRRGTAAEWSLANPVLSAGEIGFETDTKVVKVGDGVSTWSALTLATNNLTVNGDFKPQTAGGKLETDVPDTYPLGLSISLVTAANGWPISGSLITVKTSSIYISQTLVSRSTQTGMFTRGSGSGTAWSTAWTAQNVFDGTLTAASLPSDFQNGTTFTQLAIGAAGNPEATLNWTLITMKSSASGTVQIAAPRTSGVTQPLYFRTTSTSTGFGAWQQVMTKATADATYIQNALTTTKGDIIAASTGGTPTRVAVGGDTQVLTADSTTASGVRWATPATGASFGFAEVFLHGGR